MDRRCIRPMPEELENFGTPDFTIYNAGQFPCNRYTHYMTSSTSIDLNLARREMVILGTQYAGEMKKGLFSVMHYLMPKRQILSLHSGCNMGKDGDVALFFGLSGFLHNLVSSFIQIGMLFGETVGGAAENTRASYPIEYIPNAKIPCWGDQEGYKETLLKLGSLFKKNFEVFANYKIGQDGKLTEEILAAGPNY
ncbi:hypothetical protein B296_00038686 [Ensete ventricosum]|uniref:phosphoenolpyruvate carboxykinase (ATP) n=1 Tax=Ensete ventricosum TaxID=4639 RepID=A0A426Z908_ENSVE|nr:hypothetical protein B296_00038686 [Ensete ventricosum]